jgi:hypothetical protein
MRNLTARGEVATDVQSEPSRIECVPEVTAVTRSHVIFAWLSRVFVDEVAVHPFENEFPHLR